LRRTENADVHSPDADSRRRSMKLALYLPNFRDEVTVKELEDLTALAEDLDFDSVWTLDRIVVPESSDRAERVGSFRPEK
jgi:alkanesulfonate monooxygenase SsuD/methylene tetrahydromethanopterin reductase-like flavin-dependent oxidoreductase (luciferase family)